MAKLSIPQGKKLILIPR